MKKYVLFAGVNGAGKTTFYQTNQELLEMPCAISVCDKVILYDNTDEFSKIAIFKNRKCIKRSKKIPGWCMFLFEEE